MFSSAFSRSLVTLAAFAAATILARAQSVTDPRITSWLTSSSAKYARVYETTSDKTSGNAVSTWPRSGLTNGGGGQSTPAYSDVQRVAYSTNYVYIYTTGLPSYVMGNWLTPNGTVYTSWPKNRGAIHRIPRNPTIPTTKQANHGSGGVLVNGVFVWENGDAQSYANASSTASTATISMSGDGIWNRLAGVAESFNFDTANGHQPSSGAYHNHINPKALRYQLGDNVTYDASTKTYSEAGTPTRHSPIIGWANDGLPIYGPYGYSSAMDATSGIRRMTTGFVKRDATNAALYGVDDLAVTGRHKLPVWAASVQGLSQTLTSSQYGPTTTATYALGPVNKTCAVGTFAEDYEYLGDFGKTQGVDFDLNRQNVRYCVTPEFPSGTYAYFVCIDASGNTVFPDVINQEYFGSAPQGQGTVTSITESVTEYSDAGPAAAITLTGSASGSGVALQWNSAEGATYTVESSPNNSTWTTLSSSVASGGLTTSYTASASAVFFRVTLSSIASYDTSGTYGTPVSKTTTLQYGVFVIAPSITTQPGNVTVGAGTGASFTVAASGTTPLTYQWSRNNVAIGGANAATYSIASAQAADAGSYTCTVTNSAGSATSNAATLTVNVPVAPSVTSQPADVSVVAGGSATFTVAASGTAVLSYQWQKGGVPLAGATSASYTIAATQTSDAGSYTCVVTNSAGSATSNAATLIVTLAPPTIVSQPASLTAAVGGNATFTVSASGAAPFSYQWQKGGVPLSGATSSSYTIDTVSLGDAGTYACVVTNSVSSVTSSAATLTVTVPVAPTIATQPASVSGYVGTSVTFTVIANGTAPLNYLWRKDGVVINGATAASYAISVAQLSDAGSYTCLVSNVAGSATSNAATLTLTVATQPVITTQPASASIATGGSVTFTVAAVGTNPLSYQWRKNNVAIAGATSSTYTVANAQTADAAGYTCVVTNNLGSATSNTATLTVTQAPVAPTITAQPASTTALAGMSVAFAVSATGTAPLSYQWTKNGVAISGATSPSFSIVGAQAADAGAYACTVTNVAGSITSNAATLSFTTLAPPTVSTGSGNSSASVTSGGQATFSVTANGAGPFTYQWSRNGVLVTGALSSTLAVDNVQPATAGVYRATIYNANGSVTSDPFILGVASTSKVIGTGSEVGANIVHQNGNVYDQVLLDGTAATITADAGQVVRASFVDLTDDIVQVEFSGAGTLTIVLDNASGPGPAVKYNQPGINYMKGHAGLTIVGANETTNVSIFSVGRITAVNQALFRAGETYDGLADVAFLAIASTNGKFGGIRAANASFSNTRGITGVYAPGVTFNGPVYVSDISGFNGAAAMFVLGAASDVRITGGDLAQANLQPVAVKGIAQLRFVDGVTSHGVALPAQRNQARLEQDGVNVTDQIVVNPPQ